MTFSFFCVLVHFVVLHIFVAFLFRVNGFLLAFQISRTSFLVDYCRVIFKLYFKTGFPEVLTGIVIAWLDRKRELRIMKVHRLRYTSACNRCVSLQLLCSCAISQIMNHSIFSVSFLGFSR